MEPKRLSRLQELAEIGRMALEEQRIIEEQQQQAEHRNMVAAWRELEKAVSEGFPEEVREFVKLAGDEDRINEYPPERMNLNATIEAPGFAPISVCAKRMGIHHDQAHDQWEQVRETNKYGQTFYFYNVSHANRDYEDGVHWTWRYGNTQTDELFLALAVAKREYNDFQELVARRLAQESSRHAEPVYEPAEDAPEQGVVEELVKLIRDVVREEMAGVTE